MSWSSGPHNLSFQGIRTALDLISSPLCRGATFCGQRGGPRAPDAAEAEKALLETLRMQERRPDSAGSPAVGGSISLQWLVPLPEEWIGMPCVRVFDGVAVSAVVVERVSSQVRRKMHEHFERIPIKKCMKISKSLTVFCRHGVSFGPFVCAALGGLSS